MGTDLGHLERNDLGVRALAGGEVAIIGAKDPCFFARDAIFSKTISAKRGLVDGECASSRVAVIVLGGVGDECAPSTANVQEPGGWVKTR